MIRPALLACSLALTVAPALAQEPIYRAALESPAETRVIVKDISWSCEGAICAAPRTATAPDINVCSSVARRLGRLVSFQAGDRLFGSAELQRCNAAAR